MYFDLMMNSEYINTRVLKLELPRRMARGKKKLIDVMKEDINLVGVRDDDTVETFSWRQMSPDLNSIK